MRTGIGSVFWAGWVLAVVVFGSSTASAYTPTADYKELKIAGYTVFVHPRCYKQPGTTAADALDLLRIKLEEVNRLVPKKPLESIQKVRIWVEWVSPTKDDPVGGACYHVGAGWLKSNGQNPDKANGVELTMKGDLNADDCLRDQPMFVLHELTHAYHHQVIGHNNPDVKHAFRQAKERKLYESIPRVYYGKYEKPTRGYCMSNDMEYLAEITEAYFGFNDWYPFTWRDLERHDPVGWKLMETIWGPLKRHEKPVKLRILNKTNHDAVVFWIQPDGKLKESETIKAGKRSIKPTYSGHCFQVQLKGASDRYFFCVPETRSDWTIE